MSRWPGALLAAALALITPSVVGAESALPPAARQVDIDEHLGEYLPLDLPFVDSSGASVHLGDYFRDGKPVVLALFYYECPMLCGRVLEGMVGGFNQLAWKPGEQFRALTVSIDPRDTAPLAEKKQRNVLASIGRADSPASWPFLVGPSASSSALADRLGFRYAYDAATGQYAHPAVIFVATPDGRISRYLYGIQYSALDLRLALVEAGEGKTGGIVDRIILTCYHFDPASRRYGPYLMGFLRVGGVFILISVVGLVGMLFWRERREKLLRSRRDAGAGPGGTSP